MINETRNLGEIEPKGRERLDLAVYAYRVLAVLRPLGPDECEAVLHATLELNRVSLIRRVAVPPPESEQPEG